MERRKVGPNGQSDRLQEQRYQEDVGAEDERELPRLGKGQVVQGGLLGQARGVPSMEEPPKGAVNRARHRTEKRDR